MRIVEYDSSNSGGSWWLKDEDWAALEKGGWTVEWGGKYFCNRKFSFKEVPAHKKHLLNCSQEILDRDGGCYGHILWESYEEMVADAEKHPDIRWLNALATSASKPFETLKEAIEDWEEILDYDATAEGCNCCGPPHNFHLSDTEDETVWEGGSGEHLLSQLYPEVKLKNLRKLVAEKAKKARKANNEN